MPQATGQAKIPFFAETETRFFLKAVAAEIEFIKDPKGAVTQLMLHPGAADITAPKK